MDSFTGAQGGSGLGAAKKYVYIDKPRSYTVYYKPLAYIRFSGFWRRVRAYCSGMFFMYFWECVSEIVRVFIAMLAFLYIFLGSKIYGLRERDL